MKLFSTILVVFFQFSLFSVEPVHEMSAYWNGQNFCECELNQVSVRPFEVIEEKSIYFNVPHLACYGHALLDGVFCLYAKLKAHNLQEEEMTLIVPVDECLIVNQTFRNIVQLILDSFSFKRILFLESKKSKISPLLYFKRLIVDEHLPTPLSDPVYFCFYKSFPQSKKYMNELKMMGLQDNIVYQDLNSEPNIVTDFVDHIKKTYRLDSPLIKKRILIPLRKGSREIINLRELVIALEGAGYQVAVVDFEKLSIKAQIIETMQSEYMLGTYGSNLVNAIFLKPEANVVVLWHKFAKYFWSRKYCIIHSAFLSTGVRLIEYDKPCFDPRDVYSEQIHVPEYFYRVGKMNMLRPEKMTLDELLEYPLIAMYEILNVNLYIDPSAVIEQLNLSK